MIQTSRASISGVTLYASIAASKQGLLIGSIERLQSSFRLVCGIGIRGCFFVALVGEGEGV